MAQDAAQQRVRARFIRELLPIWALLDPDNLDAAYGTWSLQLAQLVRAHQDEAAQLAAAYYARFREAETGVPAEAARLLVRAPTSLPELVRKMHWAPAHRPRRCRSRCRVRRR